MTDHAAALRGLPRWHPNPYVRSAIQTIRANGWKVTAVIDTCGCGAPDCARPQCAYAYTAGLGLHGIPELAVYGLDARTGTDLLNELADLLHHHDWHGLVAAGTELVLRTIATPVRLVEILDKDDLLMANLLFPDSPALQIVWPDDDGHYPWHAGYRLPQRQQPVRGVVEVGTRSANGPRVLPRRKTWRRVTAH